MADDDEPLAPSSSPPSTEEQGGEGALPAAGTPGGAQAEEPAIPAKPKPTEAEIAEALGLMAMHIDVEDLTCREIDRRLGTPPGFTSKVLRGELPCSKTRGLQMRAAMGIDEDEFQELMREVVARREMEPDSLVRSPHKPRAKNPRSARTSGRRRAEPDDEPSALQAPAVVRVLEELKAELETELVRQGKLVKRPGGRRKRPASQEPAPKAGS